MQSATRNMSALALLITLGVGTHTAHATTAAQTCQAGKNRLAGKYAACRHGAEAKLAKTGDGVKYAAAIATCASKYSVAWQKLEAKAGGACPSNGDETDIAGVVDDYTVNVATALGGGMLSNCPADLTHCTGDLATCQTGLSGIDGQPLKTGVTTCYGSGLCAGTGQDGELRKGLTRSYTDNGDGTITDNRTGLMWEKLSDDGSIHDKNNVYSWTSAFSGKIATLNSGGGFAGYTDWRLPNVNELYSLMIQGSDERPAMDTVFNTACTAGCTVTTCSCAGNSRHLSATPSHSSPNKAWYVDLDYGGFVFPGDKVSTFTVRGVRGS